MCINLKAPFLSISSILLLAATTLVPAQGWAAQSEEAEDEAAESDDDDDDDDDDDEAAESASEEPAVDTDDDDDDDDDGPKADPLSAEPRLADHLLDFVTFGVGFVGELGGNFIDKPGDQTVRGVNTDPEYPGFAGMTSGFGPMLDVRFLGYVGFEFGVLFHTDKGSAELKITNTGTNTFQKFEVEISQSAVHLPLLLKGALPGKWVTPLLMLGPEFVIPSSQGAILSGSAPVSPKYTAFSESYTNFTFGLGLEINLPVPKVDVRIPFSLRGSINPGVDDTRESRANYIGAPGITEVSYKTEWKFQAMAHFGAVAHF